MSGYKLLKRGIEVYQQEGMKSVVSRMRRYSYCILPGFHFLFYNPITYRQSVSALEKWKQNESDLQDTLETVFEFASIGGYGQPLAPAFQRDVDPDKLRWELSKLTAVLRDKRPNTILEIGSAGGGTAYLWSRGLDSVETFIGIDNGVSFEKQLPMFEHFTDDVDLHFLPTDSHYLKTKDDIQERLDGAPIDFLFLNGDKKYSGVKDDFETYGKLVADGGIVAFHDIVFNSEYDQVGVHEFWNDIKTDYEFQEFVASDDQEWGGVGVLHMD